MNKTFDPTTPHDHYCSRCYAPVYCRAVNCEIPEYAECLPCRRAFGGIEHFDYDNHPLKNASGYRKTWPGRFAVETHTLPFRAPRTRRKQCGV